MKIIARFQDDVYPYQKYDHVRKIVRAVIYNDNKQIALVHVYGDDIFGHRDTLETPGGGVKKNERLIDALKREIKEELGAEIDNIVEIGRIIDFYNLIKRKNDNHYYLAHLKEIKQNNLTTFEKQMFESIIWLDIDKARSIINKQVDYPWTRLVKQRELPIIDLAVKMIKKEK